MLDNELLEQLKSHFSGLVGQYVFSVFPSQHASQAELLEMLESLATASP